MEPETPTAPAGASAGATDEPAHAALRSYLAATGGAAPPAYYPKDADDLELGYALALHALGTYGGTEAAAEAVHAAWRDGMAHQHREVKRDRQTWRNLHPTDQALDGMIARDVAQAATRALNGGNSLVDPSRWL